MENKGFSKLLEKSTRDFGIRIIQFSTSFLIHLREGR
jgi:hypothetical protein